MAEIPVIASLAMDRDFPLGNTIDVFGRRALHVKIGNKPDEPMPVYVVDAVATSNVVINQFNAISAVASGSETQIVSYTIPPAKKFIISLVQFSGENIAKFNFYVDGVLSATARTMFGSDLTGELRFDSPNGLGLELVAGQIISLKVLHPRPSVADFEGRILGALKDE